MISRNRTSVHSSLVGILHGSDHAHEGRGGAGGEGRLGPRTSFQLGYRGVLMKSPAEGGLQLAA